MDNKGASRKGYLTKNERKQHEALLLQGERITQFDSRVPYTILLCDMIRSQIDNYLRYSMDENNEAFEKFSRFLKEYADKYPEVTDKENKKFHKLLKRFFIKDIGAMWT